MDLLADQAIIAAARPHTPPPIINSQRLSQIDRCTIIGLYRRGGWTITRIAKELNITRETAGHWIKVYKNTGECKSGKRSGRPRATDRETDENIIITAKVVKFTSPKKLVTELGLDVSSKTVSRRLNEAGLYVRVAENKRHFSDDERKKRLSFAEGYKNWTYDEWRKVIFSDESTIYGAGYCGRVYVVREEGEKERFNPENCVDHKSHPIKINLWGCFSAAGPGYCYIFEENMTAALMKECLEKYLLPTAKELFHKEDGTIIPWHFLHDNAKTFKNDKVKEYLFGSGITPLEFPPYSPDLNPIENLWAILKREVAEVQCDNIEKLGDRIAEIWEKVDVKLCEELVRSMPRRCQAVIDANGWHTGY